MAPLPVRTGIVFLALAVVLPAAVVGQAPTPPPPPAPTDAPPNSPIVQCTDPTGCVEPSTGLRWVLARNGEIPGGAYVAGNVGSAREPIPVHICRAYFRTAEGRLMMLPGSLVPGSREPGCLVPGWSGGRTVVGSNSYDVLMALPPEIGWVRRGVPPSGTPVRAFSIAATCRHQLGNGLMLAGGIVTTAGCNVVFGGQRRAFDDYEVLESGIPVVAQGAASPVAVPPAGAVAVASGATQSARPVPPPAAVLALGHAMMVDIPGRDVFPQMIRPRKVQFTLPKRMRVAITAWEQVGGPRPNITMSHGGKQFSASREFDRPMAELLLPELDGGTYEFEVSEVAEHPAPSRAVRVAVIPTTWDVANREVMIDLANHPGAERTSTVGYMALADMAVVVTVRAPVQVMSAVSRIVLVAPDGRELASGPPPSVSVARVPSGYNTTLHHVRIERSSEVTGPLVVQTIAERVDVAAASAPPPSVAPSGAPTTPATPAGPRRDGPPASLATIAIGERQEFEFDTATAQRFENGAMQFYRVSCEQGDWLVVDVESAANAGAVLTRSGRKVTADEDFGSGTNARMFHACYNSEEHLIGVRLYGVAQGQFSISVGRMSDPVIPASASRHLLRFNTPVTVNLNDGAGEYRGYPARSLAFRCSATGFLRISAKSSKGADLPITIFEPDGAQRSEISGPNARFRCDPGHLQLYRVVVQGDTTVTLLMTSQQ